MKQFSLFLLLVMLLIASSAQAGGIPCVDDTGAVKNSSGDVCKAILPKCTDLRNKLITQMKELMEWKIYGYYHKNLDLDLNGSDLKNKNFVGESLAHPLCSVVGHKLSANEPGEINQQTIGSNLSCGQYPNSKGVDPWTYKVTLTYTGSAGTKWFSYVLGAFPWVIRRQAHDVIEELKPDLSNLDEVIKSSAMNKDVKDTLENIRKSVSTLSAEAKPICSMTGASAAQLLTDCVKSPSPFSISSPQMSICNLVSAQSFLNELSLPNMLAFETLDRAKKMQDEKFGHIFEAEKDAHFKNFMNNCSNNRGMANKVYQTIVGLIDLGWLRRAIAARKAQSCVTSCMFDGTTYHTFDNFATGKNDNGSQRNRKCAKVTRHDLNTGMPYNTRLSTLISSEPYVAWFWDAILGSSYSENKQTDEINFMEEHLGLNVTNNNGFAGMIESIIRREICPQLGYQKTGSNVCDSVGIGHMPVGAP